MNEVIINPSLHASMPRFAGSLAHKLKQYDTMFFTTQCRSAVTMSCMSKLRCACVTIESFDHLCK